YDQPQGRLGARHHSAAAPVRPRRRGDRMKRRAFITLLGGAAVAWPLAARAQQLERIRPIAILMLAADDPAAQARITALRQGLTHYGPARGAGETWVDGRPQSSHRHSLAGPTPTACGLM